MHKQPLKLFRSKVCNVGLGFSVQFELEPSGRLEALWSPRTPTARREVTRTLTKYRLHRDAFLAEVAKGSGLSVAVVEVPR